MNENNFEPLADDDVLHIEQGMFPNAPNKLIDTAGPFSDAVKKALASWPYVNLVNQDKGLPGSILKTSGGGWQKGQLRVRVVIEFQSDPPFSEDWPPQDAVT